MSALMILKLPNVTVLEDEVYICSSSRKVTALSSKTTPIKQKIKPKTSTDINLRLLNVPSAQIQIKNQNIKSPSVKKTKTFSPRKATKEYNSDKENSNDNGFDISDISDLDLYQNEEESFSSCDIW